MCVCIQVNVCSREIFTHLQTTAYQLWLRDLLSAEARHWPSDLLTPLPVTMSNHSWFNDVYGCFRVFLLFIASIPDSSVRFKDLGYLCYWPFETNEPLSRAKRKLTWSEHTYGHTHFQRFSNFTANLFILCSTTMAANGPGTCRWQRQIKKPKMSADVFHELLLKNWQGETTFNNIFIKLYIFAVF